jgi:hypothetical protein
MYSASKRRRARARRHQTIAIAILLVVTPIALYGMFHAFRIIDCNTATRNLDFMQRCIDSENCTLTAAEMHRVEAYTRMQLARCD